MKRCIDCNEMKTLSDFHNPSHRRCKFCFNINSRISHLRGYPNTFNYADFEFLRTKFKITKHEVKLYDLEHFIPVCWGHGGSHLGNLYFLSGHLNKIKGAGNPFKEFEKIKKNYPSLQHTTDEIIQHIASMNGLTINELKEFVGWCEANKRKEVTSDKTSLELWKAALLCT